MPSWRDQILKEFAADVSRLTIVADPDGLLLEEGVLEGIHARGYKLIPYDDPVAFRYAYESRFRSHWDRGEQTDGAVVLHAQAGDLSSLPYDLLRSGRRLAFSLGSIFPKLSYPVAAAIDRSDLDALYAAYTHYEPGMLGENATKEFVLRHVFETAPELIKQPSDLLLMLLRRHYRGQRVPTTLDTRLIELLRKQSTFAEWPLELIVPDRESFFAFLQERWPIFVDRMVAGAVPNLHEDPNFYDLSITGPVGLPFDHQDVRIFVDNLFLDGLLQPIEHEHGDMVSDTWVGLGVRTDSAETQIRRLHRAVEAIQSSVPAVDAKYSEWLQFARRWAELALLRHAQSHAGDSGLTEQLTDVQSLVDSRFGNWLAARYAGLINLPPVPPAMVHHLPRFLHRHIEDDPGAKIALVVVDGLALDQWLVIREVLTAQRADFGFREWAAFAWVPSLTSVSRQAIFAGKPPIYFPDSIQTTDKESKLWTQFWADQGLASHEVIYAKGLGDGSLAEIVEKLDHPKARVAGLVIDKVDKIMHGMQLGTAGMHNQVRQWAKQSYLTALLDILLEKGYDVYLTSDHGNIEGSGCGRPAEGAVADLRGERARVYPDDGLRAKVRASFPGSVAWAPVGLPDHYLALLAPARQAFTQEKQRIVCHGGASVEELIVPLVRIERKER